jgi:hypothetical protein
MDIFLARGSDIQVDCDDAGAGALEHDPASRGLLQRGPSMSGGRKSFAV